MSTRESYFLYGGGGHARVVVDAWLARGGRLEGILDDDPRLDGASILGVPILARNRSEIPAHAYVHVAVGDARARERVNQNLISRGFQPFSVVHPSAVVAASSQLGPASFVAAQAVIGPSATLGHGTIVNHCAVVDHDCVLSDWVHIAPNGTLGGAARIGKHVLIGAGAVVLPGVSIGDGSIVGAGAVVTANVGTDRVVVGVPARPLGHEGSES